MIFTTDEAIPGTGDTDADRDLYERLANGTLRLLTTSAPPFGQSPSFGAGLAGASPDGGLVWFQTREAIAGTGDNDTTTDVYERAANGTLRLVTTGLGNFGVGGTGHAYFAGADPRGPVVWFETTEAIPGAGDADVVRDVYERAGSNLRLVSSGGGAGQHEADFAAGDSGRVWFTTSEAIPGTGDTDAAIDLYERQVNGGPVRLISTGGNAEPVAFVHRSSDGRRVLFSTEEALPGTGDVDTARDLYERTAGGGLALVSSDGANVDAEFVYATADGRRVWWKTTEQVPGTGDADTVIDLYERQTGGGPLTLISAPGAVNEPMSFAGASLDGRRVWFTTAESIPGAGDADLADDLYERAANGVLRLVSPGVANESAIPTWIGPVPITRGGSAPSGARVWFVTREALPGTPDGDSAVDVYERAADGRLRLIST